MVGFDVHAGGAQVEWALRQPLSHERGELVISVYPDVARVGGQASYLLPVGISAQPFAGRPINKYEVAQLFRPYQVYPGHIHPRGGHHSDRGWRKEAFATAFKHYLGKTLPRGRAVVRTSPKKRPKP